MRKFLSSFRELLFIIGLAIYVFNSTFNPTPLISIIVVSLIAVYFIVIIWQIILWFKSDITIDWTYEKKEIN